MQNNFWNKTNVIIGLVTIIISILIAWWNNREKITSLNIEKFNETLLTKPLNIDGLTAFYIFHDSIRVSNLWQTTFVIKNTGNNTIYGTGFQERNTRTGKIPFTVNNCERVLSANVSNANNGAFIMESQNIYISQWHPREYIEVTLITEGANSPDLKISDREIKDSHITYSVFSIDETEQKKAVIYYLPKIVSDILKWLVIFVVALMTLGFVMTIPGQVKQAKKREKILTVILWIIVLLVIMSPILWMFEI